MEKLGHINVLIKKAIKQVPLVLTLSGILAPTDSFAETFKGNFTISSEKSDRVPEAYLQMCKRLVTDLDNFLNSQEYILFCKKMENGGKYATISMANLIILNKQVNETIISKDDFEKHRKIDYWESGLVDEGDCEEFVMEKFRKLVLQYKINPANLFLTVVNLKRLNKKEEGHLVLLWREGQDFYVLDNVVDDIKLLSDRLDLTPVSILHTRTKEWRKIITNKN